MMNRLDELMARLDERHIAAEVGILHDEARGQYRLKTNVVADYREYEQLLGDYCTHHHRCCSPGRGSLLRHEAIQEAKQIVQREYERKGLTPTDAFMNAQSGVEGGARAQLDLVADALKARAISLYVSQVFDDIVSPVSREERVDLIRGLIARIGQYLPEPITPEEAPFYANDYTDLVNAYVRGLRNMWHLFRRR